MNNYINIEIIKNELLRSISDTYNIPYDLLVEELNQIKTTQIAKSKYSCDHSFFSRDNEQSFYWAGFVAADGCVFKRGNSTTLNVSLSEKDLDHLKRFKLDLNFDGKITRSVTKHSLTNPNWNDSIKRGISISSFQMFQDLKRFNINPNKTKVYTFPFWLENHPLVNHFMRGYADGDGSFFDDIQRKRICFELRGNFDFLVIYKRILDKNLDFDIKNKVTTPDSTSKIKYYGKKNMPSLIRFLYKDANVYLKRKFDIAISRHPIDFKDHVEIITKTD
jgi:hypothetical protein